MINPKPGEVYWVDLGLSAKQRPLLVVSREDPDSERALVVCVPLTTQIRGGQYEVPIPRVRWLPGSEPGVANVHGILPLSATGWALEPGASNHRCSQPFEMQSPGCWNSEIKATNPADRA